MNNKDDDKDPLFAGSKFPSPAAADPEVVKTPRLTSAGANTFRELLLTARDLGCSINVVVRDDMSEGPVTVVKVATDYVGLEDADGVAYVRMDMIVAVSDASDVLDEESEDFRGD